MLPTCTTTAGRSMSAAQTCMGFTAVRYTWYGIESPLPYLRAYRLRQLHHEAQAGQAALVLRGMASRTRVGARIGRGVGLALCQNVPALGPH